jgi:hypothetical protein
VVDRLILLNGCVSGLKEVRFVRSSSVRSMFDVFDVRCSMFDVRCSMFNRPFGR